MLVLLRFSRSLTHKRTMSSPLKIEKSQNLQKLSALIPFDIYSQVFENLSTQQNHQKRGEGGGEEYIYSYPNKALILFLKPLTF